MDLRSTIKISSTIPWSTLKLRTNSMVQGMSAKLIVTHPVNKSPSFKEQKSSLSCSQNLAIVPY